MNVLIFHIALLRMVLSFKFLPEDDTTYSLIRNSALKHAATAEDIPHHVLIAFGNYYCSGSLIRSKIVLTTASCFTRRSQQRIFVKVGADTVTGPGQVIPVVEVKFHEYYKHISAVNNDIALLVLQEDVIFYADVKKAILVEPGVALRIGIVIEVSGWGHTNLAPKFYNNLIWSEMVVMDQGECRRTYNNLITSSSFCAKYQQERRLSDNGGAAMYRSFLVGLLSFGGTTKEEPHVAVFTNVSYFHGWITLNCQHFLQKYCINEKFYSDESSEEQH